MKQDQALGEILKKRGMLETIRFRVLAMGGLVERQLQDAMVALETQNAGLAQQVINNDLQVNAMEVAIDEQCNTVLARVNRRPVTCA